MAIEWEAVGLYILVKRDDAASEKGGLSLPDMAKKKPSTGDVLTVGAEVNDNKVEAGKKALFAAGNGFEIELEDGLIVTVLTKGQIIACR